MKKDVLLYDLRSYSEDELKELEISLAKLIYEKSNRKINKQTCRIQARNKIHYHVVLPNGKPITLEEMAEDFIWAWNQ